MIKKRNISYVQIGNVVNFVKVLLKTGQRSKNLDENLFKNVKAANKVNNLNIVNSFKKRDYYLGAFFF